MRGPLHGIPIALKDNIHTTDMPTTGGALAFDRYVPPYEATVTRNLREAGAIVDRQDADDRARQLGRRRADADAHELQRAQRLRLQSLRPAPRPARGHASTAGRRWPRAARARASARPRASGPRTSAPRPRARSSAPRTRTCWRRSSPPSGASAATASSRSPPTRTRRGRWRARSRDAAILLGVLERGNPDPNDAATSACARPARQRLPAVPEGGRAPGRAHRHPARLLLREGRRRPAPTSRAAGSAPEQLASMEEAIAVLKRAGAVVVDPADIPSVVDADPAGQLPAVGRLHGHGRGQGAQVLDRPRLRNGARLQRLAGRRSGPTAPVKTLDRAAPVEHRPRQGGRDQVRPVAARRLGRDGPRDVTARATRATAPATSCSPATHGIDEVMKAHEARRRAVPRLFRARRSRPGRVTRP